MIDPVTARYTEALFNLAKKNGVLDAVARDVEGFAKELASPAVSAFLFDARVATNVRRSKLDPVLSGMQELTRDFVGLLFDKNRSEVLRDLPAAFRRRMLEEEGATEGTVESERALDAAALSELSASLGARLSKRVQLTNKITPGLVGGVRVIVDNKLIDYSVRGRLDGLRKRLEQAELPSASV